MMMIGRESEGEMEASVLVRRRIGRRRPCTEEEGAKCYALNWPKYINYIAKIFA